MNFRSHPLAISTLLALSFCLGEKSNWRTLVSLCKLFLGGCVLYYSYVGAAFWRLIVTLDLYYYSSQIVNIVSAIIQLLFMISLLNTIPMQSK